MRKLLAFILVASLVTACNPNNRNDRNNRNDNNYNNRDDKNNRNDNRNDNNYNNREDRNNNNGGGWTEQQKFSWMQQCTNGLKQQGTQMTEDQTQQYCDCVLGKIQQRYKNYDDADRNGTEEEGRQLGQACLREMGIGQ